MRELVWILLGVFSPSCAFWGGLSAAAIEANPAGVIERARGELTRHLLAQEAAARWAGFLDQRGGWWLRRAVGFPPDPEHRAVLILGRAHAGVREAWRDIPRLSAELPPGSRDQEESATMLTRKVEAATRAVAEAVKTAFAPADGSLTPSAHASSPAVVIRERLLAAHQAAVDARIEIRQVLIQSAFWTTFAWSLGAIGVTLVLSATLPPPRTTSSLPSMKLPLTPALDGRDRAFLGPPVYGMASALSRSRVPRAVAEDIARWFRSAPDTPGSLRGHDREPGGLARHTLAVIRKINQLTADASPRDRTLAATLAAAHDLGKLLAYREDREGTWTGHPAVPHDSLGAQALALCPGLRESFPQAEAEDLLLALSIEHAGTRHPEVMPSNAPRRVRQLLAWLRDADAESAGAASASAGVTPQTQEETTHD